MIEVGQEAPDFTLTDEAGKRVTLSSFRGERHVVLVFFPQAFSGVCTRQLTQIGGNESRFAGQGAQVIGISVDHHFAQGAFAQTLGLGDTRLLADFHPKGEVARRYGVYSDAYGVAKRATFVIDKQGVVRSAVLSEPLEVPDEETYFRALSTCSS